MSNPSFIINDAFMQGFNSGTEQGLEEQAARGQAWEWVAENGDEALGLINGVLCTIKPNRPGCPGSIPPGGNTFFRQDQTPLYILIAVVLILLLVLLFKK